MKMLTLPSGQQMAPVPILAKQYIDSIVPGSLGSTMAALARQERVRMLRLFERFGAYYMPVGVTKLKETLWEVRFPGNAPFKNGPVRVGAWIALQANYERNRCFPGRDPLEKGDGLAVRHIDKYTTQAIK